MADDHDALLSTGQLIEKCGLMLLDGENDVRAGEAAGFFPAPEIPVITLDVTGAEFFGAIGKNIVRIDHLDSAVEVKERLRVENVFHDHDVEPLVAGGRYDGLMTQLGASAPIPAVGFSVWVETLTEIARKPAASGSAS